MNKTLINIFSLSGNIFSYMYSTFFHCSVIRYKNVTAYYVEIVTNDAIHHISGRRFIGIKNYAPHWNREFPVSPIDRNLLVPTHPNCTLWPSYITKLLNIAWRFGAGQVSRNYIRWPGYLLPNFCMYCRTVMFFQLLRLGIQKVKRDTIT